MLKLRTEYPYGLNEKVDICEDDKNVKSFKSDDGQAPTQEFLRAWGGFHKLGHKSLTVLNVKIKCKH